MTHPLISVKMIEDSVSRDDVRLSTFQLRYPRLIHAELMTHRVFSRNASSSRAIPVAKMIEQVRLEPAMPVHWGKNQPGMQAFAELEGRDLEATKREWLSAALDAIHHAKCMADRGAHKQVVNRILEPFQFISVILSTTETDNWFELRDHEDADPTIKALASAMVPVFQDSITVERGFDRTLTSNWHLPYISAEERTDFPREPCYLAKLSTARSARVSYLTHDGLTPSAAKDLGLFDQLVGGKPIHASPTEHQATPACSASVQSGNFRGWRQFRKVVEAHMAAGEVLID